VTVALRPPRRNDTGSSLAPWVAWGLWLLAVALELVAFLLFTLPNQALPAAEKVGGQGQGSVKVT
jgi:hypothetical protein